MLVEILFLSLGLAIGGLYGWWFGTEVKDASPSFHNLTTDTGMLGDPYDVVDIPGKGKGMIANRDIQVRCLVTCLCSWKTNRPLVALARRAYSG